MSEDTKTYKVILYRIYTKSTSVLVDAADVQDAKFLARNKAIGLPDDAWKDPETVSCPGVDEVRLVVEVEDD